MNPVRPAAPFLSVTGNGPLRPALHADRFCPCMGVNPYSRSDAEYRYGCSRAQAVVARQCCNSDKSCPNRASPRVNSTVDKAVVSLPLPTTSRQPSTANIYYKLANPTWHSQYSLSCRASIAVSSSPQDTILSTQQKSGTTTKMVHSKRDEKAWEDSSLEPIAIVGMGKCLHLLRVPFTHRSTKLTFSKPATCRAR